MENYPKSTETHTPAIGCQSHRKVSYLLTAQSTHGLKNVAAVVVKEHNLLQNSHESYFNLLLDK